ncbi:hypothetical protein NDU88_001940 [Pleurodeles waltl]|uniref:Uncharacterized protein n=1 Tax=Pleurodeles waltl TaxID=8319 RepID=A0AAV7W1X6_PLEWA|nr:hypothetical protein NDU88_001940 [Pleurodeles waltl]
MILQGDRNSVEHIRSRGHPRNRGTEQSQTGAGEARAPGRKRGREAPHGSKRKEQAGRAGPAFHSGADRPREPHTRRCVGTVALRLGAGDDPDTQSIQRDRRRG